MPLTPEQIKAREGRLTASQVACLMTGDKEKILNLWRELVGDPDYKPPSLSDIWAIRLGEVTEDLNLEWFARKHGDVFRQGEVVALDWASCTLDGWSEKYQCPIECKHCGGFEKSSDIIHRYMPQMHWQMIVTKSDQCILSVIQGAKEPEIWFVQFNQEYAINLWDRAMEFMNKVRNLIPPVEMLPILPPIIPEKEYDMSASNAWISAAADWLEARTANQKHKDASEAIKEMMPNDAIRAIGGGISVRRDKAGRIKIVAVNDDNNEREN